MKESCAEISGKMGIREPFIQRYLSCFGKKFLKTGGEQVRYMAVVESVDAGSIAEELGIGHGDTICRINGADIRDYLDYKFLASEEEILLTVLKADGEWIEFEIVNEYLEDLGINFKNMLFDSPKSCANRCIFCFIDQLPKNMRKSLYFKDDDSRLSFLYGNYVTFTNMKEEDVERLIRYHISPVNVSVHTTNLDLREKMLRNKNARNVLKYCRMLKESNISLNMQIVLCKGVNDGSELDRSFADMTEFFPQLTSVSVVPVGLTKYRQGLYPLEPFSAEDCRAVVAQVEKWQKIFLERFGSRLVYASDEFYLVGGLPIPPAEAYEDFPQIENGVGMLASMREEVENALLTVHEPGKTKKTLIATGELAYPFICEMTAKIKDKYPIDAEVVKIQNRFFGGKVSVSGLICGQDLIEQLQGKKAERLLFTRSMLKADEDVFLDDITLLQLEEELKLNAVPVENDGYAFVAAVLNKENEEEL